MKQIVIGVIGIGRIGKMHAENISTHLPMVRIKAVADPHVNEPWAKRLCIPVTSADSNVLFEDPEIEAIVITAPSAFHVPLIKAAAAHGKHIFCEKPIAFEPEKIQEAIDAVEAAGVQMAVGFNRRFDNNFMKIREHVQRGDIGEIQIVKITNRDPRLPPARFVKNSGGLFMDFSAHDFDMARYITSSEVAEVFAMGHAFDSGIREAGDLDTALINLRMKNGALVAIDNSREARYGYDQRLEVFGSKGSLLADNKTPTSVVLSTEEGVVSDKPFFSFVERYSETYVTELKMFIDCILHKTPTPVTGQDAIKAVEIALAAQQSLEDRKLVKLS